MTFRAMGAPRLAGSLVGGLVVAAALAACGDGGGEDDTLTEQVDLSGVEITVGSKDFTEQEVLGQITIEVLRATGVNVQDRTGLASTTAARQALESGAIDMYWEYTGTGRLVILGHQTPIADPVEQLQAVATEDRRENGIAWIAPTPANNTYAVAISSDVPDEELAAVNTLSDFGALLQQNPDEASICVASEFANRPDGLPGLVQAYGWDLPPTNVITLDDEALIYPAVDKGSACSFGEVFRTDGRIEEFDLRLLDDDKDFFASYNPTLTVRQELVEQYPEFDELFTPIAAALDESTLRELNSRVDVGGEPVEQVARDFLEEEGFLEPRQLTR